MSPLKMNFKERKDTRNKRRGDMLFTRFRESHFEKRKARKHRRLMKKYGEGGIVYPMRFKYNRRILLIIRKKWTRN
jgi:hypothetical protein